MGMAKISRLDGEEIEAAGLGWRGAPLGSALSLGMVDGSKVIADSDLASRVEAYEMLAFAQKLDSKPWMSTQGLKSWLLAEDSLEDGDFAADASSANEGRGQVRGKRSSG